MSHVSQLATQPVVSLAAFAAAKVENAAGEPAERAAAHLDSITSIVRPASSRTTTATILDLAPAIRTARLDRAMSALVAAIEGAQLPPPGPPLAPPSSHVFVISDDRARR